MHSTLFAPRGGVIGELYRYTLVPIAPWCVRAASAEKGEMDFLNIKFSSWTIVSCTKNSIYLPSSTFYSFFKTKCTQFQKLFTSYKIFKLSILFSTYANHEWGKKRNYLNKKRRSRSTIFSLNTNVVFRDS